MKKILITFLAPVFVLLIGALCIALYAERMPAKPIRHVVSPIWDRPVIVNPGAEFDVVIKSEEKPRVERMMLLCSAAPKDLEYPLRIKSIAFDPKNKTAHVTVAVNIAVPETLYDLSVWYEAGKKVFTETQPGAVKVAEKRNGTFTFAVVSHLSPHDPIQSRGKRLRETAALINELNALNPDFIVLIDGASDGIWTANMDAIDLFRLFRDNLTAPAFIVPNDSDTASFSVLNLPVRKGRKDFDSIIGSPHFSFEHEGFLFAGADSTGCSKQRTLFTAGRDSEGCIGAEELDWLDSRLKSADARGLTPILFLHHGPQAGSWVDDKGTSTGIFDSSSRKKLLETIGDNKVRAVFSGHIRRNSVGWKNNILYVTTGAAGDSGSSTKPSLRLVTVVDGKLSQRYVSYVRAPNTVPAGRVSAISRRKNDGTASSNSFVFSNGLRRPLNNVSAIAIMKKLPPNKAYAVDGDCRYTQTPGRTAQYVFLRCDLRPGEKRVVQIR